MGEIMDSGNTGSIQSSSTGGGGGDDQQFDSRLSSGNGGGGGGEPIPGLFNDNTVPFQLDSSPNNNASHSHNQQISSYHDFNPLNTYAHSSPISSHFMINSSNINNNNNNININHNDNDMGMVWPNKFTSINSNLVNSSNHIKCTTTTTGLVSGFNNNPHFIAPPAQIGPTATSDQRGPGPNPKKQTRASRRVPTTVLTTDTNNFRQMVQEFTGIPAPPFTGRTRLDLFGGLGIQLSRGGFESPAYISRPCPQKIVVPRQPTMNSSNVPSMFGQSPTKFSNPQSSISPLQSSTSLGPNATSSVMNDFALGHASTSTTMTSGKMGMNTTILEGQGSGTNISEGMVDYSWICSSD